MLRIRCGPRWPRGGWVRRIRSRGGVVREEEAGAAGVAVEDVAVAESVGKEPRRPWKKGASHPFQERPPRAPREEPTAEWSSPWAAGRGRGRRRLHRRWAWAAAWLEGPAPLPLWWRAPAAAAVVVACEAKAPLPGDIRSRGEARRRTIDCSAPPVRAGILALPACRPPREPPVPWPWREPRWEENCRGFSIDWSTRNWKCWQDCRRQAPPTGHLAPWHGGRAAPGWKRQRWRGPWRVWREERW